MEEKNQVYNFIDYSFSAQVVKDHPRIIKIYEKLLPVLYEFAAYQGVWPVIQMVEDSKLLLEIQYDFYKNVYKNKGKIQDESKTK